MNSYTCAADGTGAGVPTPENTSGAREPATLVTFRNWADNILAKLLEPPPPDPC